MAREKAKQPNVSQELSPKTQRKGHIRGSTPLFTAIYSKKTHEEGRYRVDLPLDVVLHPEFRAVFADFNRQ